MCRASRLGRWLKQPLSNASSCEPRSVRSAPWSSGSYRYQTSSHFRNFTRSSVRCSAGVAIWIISFAYMARNSTVSDDRYDPKRCTSSGSIGRRNFSTFATRLTYGNGTFEFSPSRVALRTTPRRSVSAAVALLRPSLRWSHGLPADAQTAARRYSHVRSGAGGSCQIPN